MDRADGNSELGEVRLPAWLVCALGGALLVAAVGTPWALRWSGEFADFAVMPKREGRAVRPAMVSLPGGLFAMGSPEGELGRATDEGPQRLVTVSPFALCVTEVTVSQYEAVTGNAPSDCDYGCEPDMPVHNVSWVGALRYLNQLTELANTARDDADALTRCYEFTDAVLEGIRWEPGCTGYRLPTEAEWEYAARAGSTSALSFGDDDPVRYAWFAVNADGRVHSVATAEPNAWGLFDMHGNVREWVWDTFASYDAGARDDRRGPGEAISYRVLRGGSFAGEVRSLRSASRHSARPRAREPWNGFRCARSVRTAHP